MLKGKKIIIGVTGGIAAYKIPFLVRELKRDGAQVRIVMTEGAKQFVTPLTLSTVSDNEVIVGIFPDQGSTTVDASTWHITFSRWADVMLIAPATANTLAKIAGGWGDNAVTTLALALRCPLILSPAMDADMWNQKITQENISKLSELGYTILQPEIGELASGLVGKGRMPEIKTLMRAIQQVLDKTRQDLKGKKILVTAGPTCEKIDPVRFLSNRSSGKMGFAIANAAAQRGADVLLITGRVELTTPRQVRRIDVESAEEMYSAVLKHCKGTDGVIMAAAVADFTPATPLSKKIKKERVNGRTLSIELTKTKDILQALSKNKTDQVKIGFALETDNELLNAKKKLREKNLDLIVLNNPLESGAGFGTDTNIVTIISKNGKAEKLGKMPKYDVANEILNRMVKLFSR
ncbi:MAG TPA: bifunctional phosphopantothenoylcysteine decarboxylase/phosphopantothenate--cysteine ligase CoaBC [Bacteroidota bacterium]|nr:bifunctional phosphopantothenoylcysteine decarboxylase/phosphopantothenate--cysteine ligase CoaBC [Bacteroidota bacterium]